MDNADPNTDAVEITQFLNLDLEQIKIIADSNNVSSLSSPKENDNNNNNDDDEKKGDKIRKLKLKKEKETEVTYELIDETKEYDDPKIEQPQDPKGELKMESPLSSSSSYNSKTLARSITRRKKIRVNILDPDVFANPELGSSPKSQETKGLLEEELEKEESIIDKSPKLSKSAEKLPGIDSSSPNLGLSPDLSRNKRMPKNFKGKYAASLPDFPPLSKSVEVPSPINNMIMSDDVLVAENRERRKSVLKNFFSKEKEEDSGRKRSASLGGAFSKKGDKSGIFTIKEQNIERQSWLQLESEKPTQQSAVFGMTTYNVELGQDSGGEILNNKNKAHTNYIGADKTSTETAIVSITTREESDKGGKFVRAIVRTTQQDRYLTILLPEKFNMKSGQAKANQKLIFGAIKSAMPSGAKFKFSTCIGKDIFNDLLKFELTQVITKMKVGILLRLENQETEEDMYCNNQSTKNFDEFLSLIGDTISLQGHKGYAGGLDVKKNSTGSKSLYTKFQTIELMFHVGIYLPHSSKDVQQVERKRHIGNGNGIFHYQLTKKDIVTIIFNDSKTPVNPQIITSEFNHVFLVVQPCPEDNNLYRVATVCKSGVPPFGPMLPKPAHFKKDSYFRKFFLSKVINAECAALDAPTFASKLRRTRNVLLGEIAKKYKK